MIKYLIVIGLLSLLVASTVVYFLYLVGLPVSEKDRKSDETKVSDIQNIKHSVDLYYSDNLGFPKTIEDLLKEPKYVFKLSDSSSVDNYKYFPKNGNYQICATFSNSTIKKIDKYRSPTSGSFLHPKGFYCFDFKPDTALISTPSNDGYPLYAASTPATDYNKKTKIAQSVKVENDKTIKGIKARFLFSGGSVALVTVRELVDEQNLESGKQIAQATVGAEILNEKSDQDVIFKDSAVLSATKDYVFIFEAADDKTYFNLSYSAYNPDSSGVMYLYDTTKESNYDQNKYVWGEYGTMDIYFKLI